MNARFLFLVVKNDLFITVQQILSVYGKSTCLGEMPEYVAKTLKIMKRLPFLALVIIARENMDI